MPKLLTIAIGINGGVCVDVTKTACVNVHILFVFTITEISQLQTAFTLVSRLHCF